MSTPPTPPQPSIVPDGSRVTDWTVQTLDIVDLRVTLPPYPASINDDVAALTEQNDRGVDHRGRLYFLPRTGLVVVPTDIRPGSWWGCIIVASLDPRYPRAGYDISVGDDELARAVEITIDIRKEPVG